MEVSDKPNEKSLTKPRLKLETVRSSAQEPNRVFVPSRDFQISSAV